MLRFGYDETNGQVIGDISLTGQLYYENRPQGQSFYASTERGITEEAETLVNQITKEWSDIPGVYDNPEQWTVRIS